VRWRRGHRQRKSWLDLCRSRRSGASGSVCGLWVGQRGLWCGHLRVWWRTWCLWRRWWGFARVGWWWWLMAWVVDSFGLLCLLGRAGSCVSTRRYVRNGEQLTVDESCLLPHPAHMDIPQLLFFAFSAFMPFTLLPASAVGGGISPSNPSKPFSMSFSLCFWILIFCLANLLFHCPCAFIHLLTGPVFGTPTSSYRRFNAGSSSLAARGYIRPCRSMRWRIM
jgi:hypothetical protein